jgi:hypothetical protein
MEDKNNGQRRMKEICQAAKFLQELYSHGEEEGFNTDRPTTDKKLCQLTPQGVKAVSEYLCNIRISEDGTYIQYYINSREVFSVRSDPDYFITVCNIWR